MKEREGRKERWIQWKYEVELVLTEDPNGSDNFFFPVQISYLCVLRAVGRSAGTQPVQKIRIRQLVSSTILIFLVCFSPYHVFLLVRTLLERDCSFIAGTDRSL